MTLDSSIFRAYDIRGVVGDSLTEDTAYHIGRALGSQAREAGLKRFCVGRDGRLSGPMLSAAVIRGLEECGLEVVDIGAAPTPVLYYAAHEHGDGTGVMVTGSHNPPDYNGFKVMIGGETLSGDAIQAVRERIQARRYVDGQGTVRQLDVLPAYVTRITGDIRLARPMKIVADAGNGIAGIVAQQLYEGLGAEVVPLYCDVDGTFPNHHPDPGDPHNLEDLVRAVADTGADLGLAFDGDGDRLGVVTRDGEVIYPDRLLMLFARDVLARVPGATIIYDVKCTGHLATEVERAGGRPLMWRTGHSLIKAKMKAESAPLAGEMSGHFFFKERWYGFDDGLYAGARLLEILAAQDGTPEAVFAGLPKGVSTPELKINMREGEHYAFIERFSAQARFDGAAISTIDGIRADWPDGWGLVRCSNTTPCLVLRFDADDEAALARIQSAFRARLHELDGGLTLPF
ncbi:phosphomannomutase/phosphoglucomutase [Pseudofulvimonas gallinarii]|jgi:phosphomannomutase/phosphoglucomutase|uniref:phosphomannomutase n=1 Tax=Pseudofulvimonas gallinarii TaxID=634155 RepID=A0A4R3LG41_9GAMM|nr:phosphomannomutase/phosphoglucomutase [Pseudofulvimonas gallinarii]THD13766.1 phosphomannomutase/phosphoglucomutase [Pseudofulvimonas gallinarii]